ncbi:MAG: FecR family protein [Acidobacteria bacterium]|nr:FecR family protein [Acidobacteriota bacterium]
MRIAFKNIARSLFVLSFVVFCATSAALGQNRENHLISARAGGVNYVSGDVRFRHEGETSWQRLSSRHNLESGDVVRTGAGQVEVLLNPGSYVRMADNSEFEMTDTSLDSLRLKLRRGSALIEATGYDKSEVEIAVETPQTQAKIIRSGIYRINVLPSNVTEVAVRKGRALVGAQALLVKGGKVARVSGVVEVAKLEKTKDALDIWSKERANNLAEANQQLARRNNRSSLNSMLAGMSFGNQAFRQSSGLWVFSSFSGCYTFLPFYPGWNSPYGSGYYSTLGFYTHPGYGGVRPVIYTNPGYSGGGVSPSGNPNPSTGGGNSGAVAPAREPREPREMPGREDIPTKMGADNREVPPLRD